MIVPRAASRRTRTCFYTCLLCCSREYLLTYSPCVYFLAFVGLPFLLHMVVCAVVW